MTNEYKSDAPLKTNRSKCPEERNAFGVPVLNRELCRREVIGVQKRRVGAALQKIADALRMALLRPEIRNQIETDESRRLGMNEWRLNLVEAHTRAAT